MCSLYESFDIMQVDEETKQIVSSYMCYQQHTLLSNNKLLRIIPELVHHICILYYYRTHSIYEWKVTDEQQLDNIKNAVPGQSFNHHFKLHKLDWFLKFYPNGTKQSKEGNVFLLLYLRSTPEISRMSATCKVWLYELDKGREHYKDFNDKNKYTGWRSGLVKTDEISSLNELTFQVTITIFEIYDKEQNNVTNKYIGLGIDNKQTICYLRKELQFEKEKVQKLTIEVDELADQLYKTPQQDIDDDEKQLNKKELEGNINDVDLCKLKFEEWLCNTVKLGQYLSLFVENECNDIRMIEFFEEGVIEREVGIKHMFHRKLIIKKAIQFKQEQYEFTSFCDRDLHLKQYKNMLEINGILTWNDLMANVEKKQDLNVIFGDHANEKCVERVWDFMHN